MLFGWILVLTGIAYPDDGSRNLMNLNYYPHPHMVEVTPRVISTISDQSVNNTNFTKSSIGANHFDFGLVFGILDGVRLSVAEDLLWDQVSVTTLAGGNQTVTTSAGFSNPTFGARWRLFETGWLGADLGVEYTPSFGPKVTGDGAQSKTGNNLSGSSTNSLLLNFFWRWGINEIGFFGTMNANSVGRTEGQGALTSFDSDAFVSSVIALSDRLHVTDGFFLQGGAAWNLPYQFDTHNDNNVDRTVSVEGAVNPKLDIGFRPDPGVVIEVSSIYHYGTTKVISQKGGSTVTDNTNVTAHLTMLHEF